VSSANLDPQALDTSATTNSGFIMVATALLHTLESDFSSSFPELLLERRTRASKRRRLSLPRAIRLAGNAPIEITPNGLAEAMVIASAPKLAPAIFFQSFRCSAMLDIMICKSRPTSNALANSRKWN
jgi:hypothetical protein